jgi:Tol biopolymer transport system component
MPYPPSYNLWKVPLDGGAQTQLTFGESSYEFPDLGMQSDLVVSRVRAQANVWRFPIGGDPAENVRHGTQVTRQTGVVQTVTVSPDETQLAFLSDNGGHANVWTRRLTDFGQRNVVIARRIAWSADGQHVYASVSDVDSDIVLLAGLE